MENIGKLLIDNKHFLYFVGRIMGIFILFFAISFLLKILIKYTIRKLNEKNFKNNASLIAVVEKPISFFLWSSCFLVFVKKIETFLSFDVFNTLNFVKTFIISFGSIWFFSNFINQYAKNIISDREERGVNFDTGTIDFIKKILTILITVIVVLVSLSHLGLNLSAVLTIGGIGGLAISFAAKDLLSNVIGGLSIYLDKPFSVGDWISSPDKKIEGIVENIGWRQTKIQTFGNYPLYLPNFIFSEILIENKGRMVSRQIFENIPIRFTDASLVEKITKEITEYLESNVFVDKNMDRFSVFQDIGLFSLEILVFAYCTKVNFSDFLKIKQEIILKSIEIINKNGGELATYRKLP